jgi:hypothetical protein
MARTIAALFDDPGRAEGALQAFMTAGLSGTAPPWCGRRFTRPN